MKKTKVQCGKAHAGNKNLERIAAGFRQCVGCGMCYTAAEVSAAKAGNFAGRGLPYIVAL